MKAYSTAALIHVARAMRLPGETMTMSPRLTLQATDGVLGAQVLGLDLRTPMDALTRQAVLDALAEHGVLCFPDQSLDPVAQKAFAAQFGSLEVNVASANFQAANTPEVMVLSNIAEGGRPIGLSDAGQGWHTDMSYSAMIALATVLHAVEVPYANGHALGATQFCNMYAAYDGLSPSVKQQIDAAHAVHDFEKFWEMMRRRADCSRAPLSAAQRAKKPPVRHPMVITHPVSGRRALYANPGYTVHIEGMEPAASDALLEHLFSHQLNESYRYQHQWRVGDVLMWDNIATIHNAVADYGPSQRRLMRRCQVMADRVFASG